MSPSESRTTSSRAAPLRRFGRFVLEELLGRSQISMVWRVTDASQQVPRLLVLPRRQPPEPALSAWHAAVRRAARLQHPGFAALLEAGEHERWPFLLYAEPPSSVLAASLQRLPLAPREAATACQSLCEALAYAHESGSVHGDLGLQMLLLDDQGRLKVMGWEVACGEWLSSASQGRSDVMATLAEADRMKQLRAMARRDVQGAGLLLYTLLSNSHPMGEPDWGAVIARLPPDGHESIRLPWRLPKAVPDALRAMVNRSADRNERLRYASARTLAHALDGWRKADADSSVGPLAILLDRLSAVGTLPASPGGAGRAARIALMDKERTVELAEAVMQDVALTFELLRQVNAALSRGGHGASSGPVLTVRRAIALLGLNGVRRAALALRPWPGPLNEADGLELQRVIHRTQRAASLAQALRPAHWDAEMVALVVLLQGLGSLLVHYHLPDDARQIKRLMQPQPPAVPMRTGTDVDTPQRSQPGMGEQEASLAVLGVDPDAVSVAVARHWGLDDAVTQLMRRWPRDATILVPGTDDAFLRALASCAHETIEAAAQPAASVQPALTRVAHRYSRALHVTVDMLRQGLEASTQGNAAKAGVPASA
ncbi:MAG: HDOD domain-containing protein [Rubrivivax sp.]|jgi:non-specific serine/threonine protein kinase|nr:HDOD domain-containing protein [Rubrivivax sp.]